MDVQPPMILLQTPDFLVVSKPPGMETISQDGGPELTATLRQSMNEPGLTPVHRLDRDTSGAQLLSRTPEAEQELTGLFRKRMVDKTYLALCLGVPRNQHGVINRNLSDWSGGRRPVRVIKRGGLEASTEYRVLSGTPDFAAGARLGLLSFSPRQGRTHQIRVHAAAFGYPILGDDQYGDRTANREVKQRFGLDRQALHSWKLSFNWRGKPVTAVCPLPEDMLIPLRSLLGEGFGERDIVALSR